MSLQVIENLQNFWKSKCDILIAYDLPIGAATLHYATVFYTLQKLDFSVAFVQPCRRPQDGRYGKHPNRVYQHHQYQVVLSSIPENIQVLCVESLRTIFNTEQYYIEFLEDNWENPGLGAKGIGYEIRCNQMEVCQFTYFQQLGGAKLKRPVVELAYGIERIALIMQNQNSINDILWNSKDTYGALRQTLEEEWCRAAFNGYDIEYLRQKFHITKKIAYDLIEKNLLLAAYEEICQMSHLFNLIECQRISSFERLKLLSEVRQASKYCLEKIVKQ